MKKYNLYGNWNDNSKYWNNIQYDCNIIVKEQTPKKVYLSDKTSVNTYKIKEECFYSLEKPEHHLKKEEIKENTDKIKENTDKIKENIDKIKENTDKIKIKNKIKSKKKHINMLF
jgi:hypothetical protein